MSCTCKDDIEAELLANFKAKAADATDHAVQLEGYGIVMNDNALVIKPLMPYKATANYKLKNGSAKAKKLTGSMFFSYCPFCGESLAGAS